MEQSFTVTHIKIKKSVLHITLNTGYPVSNPRISLFYQNLDQEISYPFQVKSTQDCICTAFIDLSPLKISEGDWNVVVHTDREHATDRCPVTLDKQVRARLLVSRNLITKNHLILFPMGTTGHRMILRCRTKQPYDSLFFRIKEFAAFGSAKLLGSFLKKRSSGWFLKNTVLPPRTMAFIFSNTAWKIFPLRKKSIFILFWIKIPLSGR